MPKQIFVNLPVLDLKRSMNFFEKLGFKFNKKFTDNNAACLIVGKNMYVMLLLNDFFKNFTTKQICNAKNSTEMILAISVESKKKIDTMVATAIKAGAMRVREPQDHGYMYAQSIEDLDGHIWEFIWMNERKMAAELKKVKK